MGHARRKKGLTIARNRRKRGPETRPNIAIRAGPRNATVRLTARSPEAAFDGLRREVRVALADDDRAGVVMTPLGIPADPQAPSHTLLLYEGGAAVRCAVTLSSQPHAGDVVTMRMRALLTGWGRLASDVHVQLERAAEMQLRVVPDVLAFDASNWSTAVHVELAATNDTVAEGPSKALLPPSSDSSQFSQYLLEPAFNVWAPECDVLKMCDEARGRH